MLFIRSHTLPTTARRNSIDVSSHASLSDDLRNELEKYSNEIFARFICGRT